MNYDQRHPGRFLRAGMFDNKPVTLTIKRVYLEALEKEDGTQKTETIVAFEETERELVLVKTNDQAICAIFGEDDEGWIGHKVTFFPTTTMFGHEEVAAIRVLGSPELTAEKTYSLKLPRKRPKDMKLVPTGKPKAAVEAVPDAVPADDLQDALESPDETPEEQQFLADTLQETVAEIPPAALRATAKQVKAIHDAATQTEIPEAKYNTILRKYGAKRAQELTAPQADLVLEDIKEFAS